MGKYEKRNLLLLYCFFLAAAYLLICSKSSPLYPMNDWVDVNCFLTMGKSLLEGLVPYRDLYEQKGPVLYFVYALVALVSRRSFFGVYLLEVLTYGLFLYYSGKIASLYLKDAVLIRILVAIEGALIVISRAFSHGASVEEMCLFMSAYALYVCLRAMKRGRTLSFRESFTCGIWAGMLLWIKYTMLGFFLGLAVFIIIWYLGWGGHFKALICTTGSFLAGIGAVSVVVFLYFLANGALGELFTVYFYNNIFLYAKEPDTSRLQTILSCLNTTLTNNTCYSYLFLPAVGAGLVCARRDIRPLLMGALCFSGLALGTYWGGWSISYYGLVFSVFTVFGLTAVGVLLEKATASPLFTADRRAAHALTILVLVFMLNLCRTDGRNVYLLGTAKEDMPQYRFAEIIRQTPDATLLNYGFLDGGFYYAADVTPNCRFFCILNVQAPDMWDTQREYVRDGKVDFVVTRDRELSEYYVDSSRYTCIDSAELYFEGKTRTYYLYRLTQTT